MENLPVAQLKSLKTHFVHLGQRIEELNMVVHGHGNQSGPPWLVLTFWSPLRNQVKGLVWPFI